MANPPKIYWRDFGFLLVIQLAAVAILAGPFLAGHFSHEWGFATAIVSVLIWFVLGLRRMAISTRSMWLFLFFFPVVGGIVNHDQINRNLRGSFKVSPDHKTYLVIEDDNAGGCDPLMIDGAKWNLKKGEAGAISAGAHKIQCGKDDSGIGFDIPDGTVFSYDYWGP